VKFEVYCDESQPDVFWTKARRKAKYLLIGGIWIPAKHRQKLKSDISRLKARYRYPGEIKWHKVQEGVPQRTGGLVHRCRRGREVQVHSR
jgi:hypothetical protein